MSHLKFYTKKAIVFFMALTLSLNSFAATPILTKNQFTTSDLETVVTKINADKLTPQKITAALKKRDSKKADELNAYFNKNSGYKDYNIPLAKIENNKITFVIEGTKFLFTMTSDGDFLVEQDKKSVIISYLMSIEEVQRLIEKTFYKNNKTAFDFVIPSAHANLLVAGLAATTILYALFVYMESISTRSLENSLVSLGTKCDTWKFSSEVPTLEELRSTLGLVTNRPALCAPASDHCRELVSKARTCLTNLISKMEEKAKNNNPEVNDSSRNIIKARPIVPSQKPNVGNGGARVIVD